MTGRVRLKATEKYADAIKKSFCKRPEKTLDGLAVIFDDIEKTRKEGM